MEMKAAVLREYGKPVTVETINLASPKENEVLVKTAYTGFCHSDLMFIEGGFAFPLPLVLWIRRKIGRDWSCSTGIYGAVAPHFYPSSLQICARHPVRQHTYP
jgi:hypothetical protein